MLSVERSYGDLYRGAKENFDTATYYNVNDAFEGIYAGLSVYGKESAPRGMKVKEVLGAAITILNPADNIVYSDIRKMSARYLCGEYLWYKSASNKLEDIAVYSNFWDHIANPDGTVNSGYGYHLFNGEWDKLVADMKRDPDTRQGVIQIPINANKGTKDVPCTSSLQFILRDGKLNMIVYMRSNDIWKGFVYDLFNFTMFQLELAKTLGVEIGWYKHMVGSLHLYEPDFKDSSGTYLENPNVFEIDPKERMSESFLADIQYCADKQFDKVNDPALKLLTNSLI